MKARERLSAYIRRPRVAVILGAALLWTAFWGVSAVRDVLTETVIGRGQMGPTLEAWEALQVVMVSAVSGIRWAAGIALVVGLLATMGLMERAHARS